MDPELFIPGSYANRSFLQPPNHLGEDIALPEGHPVLAMASGKVVYAGPADGYGELLTVVEHRLAAPVTVRNGKGGQVPIDAFLSINGHLIMIASLTETFNVVPMSGPIDGGFNMLAMAQWGGEMFRIGFSLALPIITAILLVNISLGIMARVAPQLSIFSVGFALTLFVGLVMLYWLLPYFTTPLEQYLSTPLWMKSR